MTAMNKLTWVFIMCVAMAGAYFTCCCHSSILEWEANSVASFVCRQTGVCGAVALRALALAYAALMARLRSRCGWLITPVCGLAHLYLLTVLAQSYQHLGVLAG